MAYTEAHKRATAKYQAKAYDRVSVCLPKGTVEQIKALGISVNSYIVSATLEKLESKEK